MTLPHAGLQGRAVERARLATLDAGRDLCLESCNCSLALLVLADQVADIVARIAEATVMGAAFDPVLHWVRQRYIHRGHVVLLLHAFRIAVHGNLCQGIWQALPYRAINAPKLQGFWEGVLSSPTP